MPGRLLFLLAVLSFPFTATAEVYKWTDENGDVHYGDEEPDTRHQRFRFQGYTEIESRGNTRVRSRVEREADLATRQNNQEQESYQERRQRLAEEREAQELAKRCERYVESIDHIDSRLRAGGYSNSLGNRLRAERRELFSKRSRECLRNH